MWGRLDKLLQREGVKPEVSEKFYRVVVQAVLFFGAETWVILVPMLQRLEEAHVGVLRQVTVKHAMRQRNRSWKQVTEK